MDQLKSGIYKIQSTVKPERVYIGSALNLSGRKSEHLSRLRKNKHHSQKLQRHYNKYGEDDLDFSVLIDCKKEHLLKFEQAFITYCEPYFNTCKIAGNTMGVKHSEETRRQMSERSKRQVHTEERKNKMRDFMNSDKNPLRGKHPSVEARLKMSMSRRGRKLTEEWKKKIGDANRGKKRSLETRKKYSIAKMGKSLSEETRKKMSIARNGRCNSEETREKISIANKGRHQSEETKQKISLAKIGKTHKGTPCSDETKAKISMALRSHFQSLKKQSLLWQT